MPRLLAVLIASPVRAVATAVVVIGLAGLAILFGPGAATTPVTATSGLAAGAQSTRAAALAERIPGGAVSPAVVVISRKDRAILGSADVEAGGRIVLAGQKSVPARDLTGVASPLEARGTVAVAVLPIRGGLDDTRTAALVKDLRAALRVEAMGTGLAVQVTGEPAVNADLSAVFDGADSTLLFATVAVVAVLLLLTYRSPVLWALPLVAVGLAERGAVAIVGATAGPAGVPVDGAAAGILSVLVFGAGTDYALLLVARYRDELHHERDRFLAMRTALSSTAPAVLASGGTVVASLLALLACRLTSLRGLGFACAVGVACAMVAGLVLLPALLVLPGRWIFWPRVPHAGDPASAGRLWVRVGRLVGAAPTQVAVLGVVVLVALATGTIGIRDGLTAAEQFRVTPESITAQAELAQGLPAGAASPLTVVTPAAHAEQVQAAAARVPGVASATRGASGDGLATVEVVLDAAPGTTASSAAIRSLRHALRGTGSYVGGATAISYDTSQANRRDTNLVVPLVLLVVALVLVLLLRSLVAAALLVATVILSYGAALGAAWWICSGLYGFPALDVSVPLLSFLFLVALGVDYNIFLVERAHQLVRADGISTRAGILSALIATGPVITSAGILLAAVFAVLGVLPLVVLTQIGIIVGLGVLLDTLLVRTLVVPALIVALGERFWWPTRPRQYSGGADAATADVG